MIILEGISSVYQMNILKEGIFFKIYNFKKNQKIALLKWTFKKKKKLDDSSIKMDLIENFHLFILNRNFSKEHSFSFEMKAYLNI